MDTTRKRCDTWVDRGGDRHFARCSPSNRIARTLQRLFIRRSNDQWAYYQAKKFARMSTMCADLLNSLSNDARALQRSNKLLPKHAIATTPKTFRKMRTAKTAKRSSPKSSLSFDLGEGFLELA